MTFASGSDSSPVVAGFVVPKVPVTLDTQGRVRTSKDQRRTILGEVESLCPDYRRAERWLKERRGFSLM